MNDLLPKPNRYSHPGKAGRKPLPSTLVSRALKIVDRNLPAIFEALIKKALEGDREAQIYLIDRQLGKPKQQTEIVGGEQIGASLFVELFTVLQERKREIESQKLIETKGGFTEDGQSVTERAETRGYSAQGKALQEET